MELVRRPSEAIIIRSDPRSVEHLCVHGEIGVGIVGVEVAADLVGQHVDQPATESQAGLEATRQSLTLVPTRRANQFFLQALRTKEPFLLGSASWLRAHAVLERRQHNDAILFPL